MMEGLIMDDLQRLDYVKVIAPYSPHYEMIGKIASVVETKGLMTSYDVWFQQQKVTIRFRSMELEKV